MNAIESDERIDIRRVLWSCPLTLLASVVAVTCIRFIAVGILNPDPDFQPLQVGTPIFDTVLFGGAAVYLFYRKCIYDLNPIRAYRSLARKALIVSFVPDVLVGMAHWMGSTWSESFVLMSMHVAVWALCVAMLPALVRRRG
jgi:hypothetical protein